jgi:N-hydroxyarylamine O-acetyltransferase
MDEIAQDAYLERTGARRPAAPDAESLRDLQRRHLIAVPFENLSIPLGEDITLETDALYDKVVRRRRGGFCYELNGAFGALLAGLGYGVELLAGRVRGDDRWGIPFDHLALAVRDRTGQRWLVDVGFGQNSHHPLCLDDEGEQRDPAGTFRIAPADGGDLDVLRNGNIQYRLEARPRQLADFAAGCWWHRTSPRSHFTRSLVCSRLTEDGGRVTLAGRELVFTSPDGERNSSRLGADEVLPAYLEHFGIALDREPPEPRDPSEKSREHP